VTAIDGDAYGMPRLVDIETLTAILPTSVRHVRRLVAENRIPYIKVGHFIRFDVDEIRRWLNTNRRDWVDTA
jgi:excisionase family DNA binding protein